MFSLLLYSLFYSTVLIAMLHFAKQLYCTLLYLLLCYSSLSSCTVLYSLFYSTVLIAMLHFSKQLYCTVLSSTPLYSSLSIYATPLFITLLYTARLYLTLLYAMVLYSTAFTDKRICQYVVYPLNPRQAVLLIYTNKRIVI